MITLIYVAAIASSACGSKKDSTPVKKDATTAPSVPPIAVPTLGVISLPPWSFPWNEGDKDYDKALAAYRSKVRDWPAIRQHCEAAIAKDAEHYDAHRLLATALAQAGEHAAAVEQLVLVLAADYYKYAPSLTDDDELRAFFATPHGIAIRQLVATLGDEYARRIATGVWLVGRRSTFKWPKAGAPNVASSRGELYAFDRDTRRYLRLTHTDHQVAGFVRSPDGKHVATIGFDKVDRGLEADATPSMARAWVQVYDGDWAAPHKRAVLAGPIRELAIGYAATGALVVSTATAEGRWGLAPPVTQVVDAQGKLGPSTDPVPAAAITLSLEEGRVMRAAPTALATWAGDPPTTSALQLGTTTIRIPESGTTARSTVALAPDGAHVAFATAIAPCAAGAAPSLYVADTKGALVHVITARSRFDTRWIDASTLAYEDGEGAIRLWSAATAHEAMRIENAEGIALDVLSLAPAPICKQQAAVTTGTGSDAGSGSGSDIDEPMPPEEGAGPGPIATPP